MPQDTRVFTFHSTQDSTFNTSKHLKNFSQVSAIQYIDFLNGEGGNPLTYFKNNRFGSFINNRDLKILRLEVSPSDSSVTPIKAYLPDLGNNFTKLTSVSIYQPFHQYTNDLNFAIPDLDGLVLKGYSSSGQIDTVLNQIASGTTRTHGVFITETSALRTSASDQAVAILTAKDWALTGAGLNVSNTYTPHPWTVDPDSVKVTDAFTDFINQKFGTSMTWNQVRDLYYQKCGAFPDCCSLPTGPMLCPDADSVLPALVTSVPAPCVDSSS